MTIAISIRPVIFVLPLLFVIDGLCEKSFYYDIIECGNLLKFELVCCDILYMVSLLFMLENCTQGVSYIYIHW